jgi:hypothetical protein
MNADGREGATVPVAVVSTRTEAELIVGMLRSYDLEAAVYADDAGGQEPQLQAQGVRVLVAPSDEAVARQLLADADANANAVGDGGDGDGDGDGDGSPV